MERAETQDINAILDRLLQFYGLRRDTQLAERLGVARNTVSSWRSRATIPYDVFRKVSERDSLSLDWILEGRGAPDLNAEGVREPAAAYGDVQERARRALEIVLDVKDDLGLEPTKQGMKDYLDLVFTHSLTRKGLKDVIALQFKARNLEPPIDQGSELHEASKEG